MGNEEDAYPADGEGPVRSVHLSPFAISSTSVTTAEFALGREGADADTDARLLLDLEEAGVAVQGRVMVELAEDDLASPAALNSALVARRRSSPKTEAVLRLARDLDARSEAATLVKPGRPSLRRLLRRLLT